MYIYEKRKAIEAANLRRQQIFEVPDDVSYTEEDIESQSYVALMSSISHTYGNVLAYVQDWVMNIFPDNLFKTIHVNSKIAHRQIRSTTHEMLKKSKPMIIFRPRIPNIDEERFMKGTMIMERHNDIFATYDSGAYQPFFSDPKNNIAIKYQMNRSVMYIDVVAIFSTLIQQLDFYHYLANAMTIGHPFFLETCLENYLPQDMLMAISKLSGVPIYDGSGSIKPFIEYLNANSNSPITYKLQGASGNKEFYRYYPANIDTVISDLDKDEGDRVGQVMDNYQISFTMRMEFNTTGFYFLFSDHVYDIPMDSYNPENTDIIPVFTDVLLREDLNLAFGWHLYNRASYRLETENDSVNINEMLNDQIRAVIKYHYENGILLEDYIDLKVRKQGKLITAGVDYNIDWKTTTITFTDQSIYPTYSILICVNIRAINELTDQLFGFSKIRS